MKKLFICVAVVSAFSFASCKKDHTCTCTTTSTVPGSTANTDVYTIIDSKKGDAKKRCIDNTSTFTFGGVSYTSTSTCELK
ncbi:MAG: hypothetical protein K8R85_13695 [Bacteroidetes bacterium]|nr:hypothetical protein [Bacteroidota bacterium]